METRDSVREFYGKIASGESESCCAPSCCAGEVDTHEASVRVGYTAEQLAEIPQQANLGLGCGNPTAIAELKAGEVVLDLGSGAGIDAFLAAQAVGPTGKVLGVDMSHEMIARARETATDAWPNVEFRLGEIENLPIADASVDVVISNCVINLSTDKQRVFDEVFRTLKPGGRLRVSDVLARKELPVFVRKSLDLVAACVGGAVTIADTEAMLRAAGFDNVEVEVNEATAAIADEWVPGASEFVASAIVRAQKPR